MVRFGWNQKWEKVPLFISQYLKSKSEIMNFNNKFQQIKMSLLEILINLLNPIQEMSKNN